MHRCDYCDGFALISMTVSSELYWNTLGLNDTVTSNNHNDTFVYVYIVAISVTASLKLSWNKIGLYDTVALYYNHSEPVTIISQRYPPPPPPPPPPPHTHTHTHTHPHSPNMSYIVQQQQQQQWEYSLEYYLLSPIRIILNRVICPFLPTIRLVFFFFLFI